MPLESISWQTVVLLNLTIKSEMPSLSRAKNALKQKKGFAGEVSAKIEARAIPFCLF
jgi:hypothetical protein